jgi:acyl dehydratase
VLSSYAKAAVKLVPLVGGGKALPDEEKTLSGATVDRERLTEYQRVCGFGVRDTLPATYLHMLAFPLSMELMTRMDFPFGVIGLVHVENEIEHLRPVVAGETFDLKVATRDLRDHDRGRQFDVVASADVAGETVWRSKSTYLHREGGGGGGKSGEKSAPPKPSAIWQVPGDQGRRYAAVSGDSNPIHLWPLTARLFGFPKPIAHGMWVKARCLAALDSQLPDAYTVAVRFKLPMLLPAKAGFATDGHSFDVFDARSGKPHVSGSVS